MSDMIPDGQDITPEDVDELMRQNADNPDLFETLYKLKNAVIRQQRAEAAFDKADAEFAIIVGQDVLRSFDAHPVTVGGGPQADPYSAWGLANDGSTVYYVEVKIGEDTADRPNRVVRGVSVPPGSTTYFTDVTHHDPAFLSWATDPVYAATIRGLKNGTVGVRFLQATQATPADQPTSIMECFLNPDFLDWSWLPSTERGWR